MIALDTNVLVRLFTEDDPLQARRAENLLRGEDGPFFLPDLVLAELVWVLQRSYEFSRDEVRSVLLALLERRDVVFEDEEGIRTALRAYEEGLDFADGLIIARARAAGCSRLASFDGRLKTHDPRFVVNIS